jgi:hypothetical protein
MVGHTRAPGDGGFNALIGAGVLSGIELPAPEELGNTPPIGWAAGAAPRARVGTASAEKSKDAMTQQPYQDPSTPGQGPQDVPGYQGIPQAPPIPAGYGYGVQQQAAVPPGMYYDPNAELLLPEGVVLAPVGRRIGAFFLAIVLSIVTLGIGYVIWGLIAWGHGTSPALKVLGMRCWKPAENRVASWGTMALRDIVGGIAQGILSLITAIVSFVLFLSGKKHQSLPDLIGGTVVVYDPNKVLGA